MCLLSICIPTYNRDVYLAVLLDSLAGEMAGLEDKVEVVVSDNASTDATQDLVARYRDTLPLRYFRNEENVGAERNFLRAVEAARGEYCWLFGDDERLSAGALQRVVGILEGQHPDLLIVNDQTTPYVSEDVSFDSFGDFVRHFVRHDVRVVLWSTLISFNIFRKAGWDGVRDKERFLPSRYLHSCTIAEAWFERGKVLLKREPLVIVRKERPNAADPLVHTHLEVFWLHYLYYLVYLGGPAELRRYANRVRIGAVAKYLLRPFAEVPRIGRRIAHACKGAAVCAWLSPAGVGAKLGGGSAGRAE
jgi:glycosyltransferase involved in cell wall biosynthesis